MDENLLKSFEERKSIKTPIKQLYANKNIQIIMNKVSLSWCFAQLFSIDTTQVKQTCKSCPERNSKILTKSWHDTTTHPSLNNFLYPSSLCFHNLVCNFLIGGKNGKYTKIRPAKWLYTLYMYFLSILSIKVSTVIDLFQLSLYEKTEMNFYVDH